MARTPGPWRYSFESVDLEWAVVTTAGGAVIANVNADHRQEANARLIAAAPDMLAALQTIALWHEAGWQKAGFLDAGHMAQHVAETAIAAIAKAKATTP